ncbi:hypothetical protein GFGA_1c0180 [Gluconobacter frateurii NBRC 103465]|nr:hypothetical protein GFGA_1c0180 [Gluconobacter frateurii NBRC 103465]
MRDCAHPPCTKHRKTARIMLFLCPRTISTISLSTGAVKRGLPPGCSPHGLRKAAARRLAEAGCTTHQIAAITEHRSLAEVARYTQAAKQVELAR